MKALKLHTHTNTFIGRKNGITLIALVITIVVLIILATVAIQLGFGQNGIFNLAKRAKEKYQTSANEEALQLASYDEIVDQLVEGINGTRDMSKEEVENLISKAVKEKVDVSLSEYATKIYVDSQYNLQEYSTTEKAVGTWVDGKTIYQITITGLKTPSMVKTFHTVTVESKNLNIDSLINLHAIYNCVNGAKRTVANSNRYITNISTETPNVDPSIWMDAEGKLGMTVTNSNDVNCDLTVTLQYTKK